MHASELREDSVVLGCYYLNESRVLLPVNEQAGSLEMTMRRYSLNLRATAWVLGLFGVEVLIALYVHDWLIRPYGGDVLAALFVYVCLRAVIDRTSSLRLALAAFTTGACVEVFQACELPVRLGLTHNPILRVAIGTTFQWGDLVAYAIGAVLSWLIDEKTEWIRSAMRRDRATSHTR
jgi:hypothetical protein